MEIGLLEKCAVSVDRNNLNYRIMILDIVASCIPLFSGEHPAVYPVKVVRFLHFPECLSIFSYFLTFVSLDLLTHFLAGKIV
jgi:hypothetical protein